MAEDTPGGMKSPIVIKQHRQHPSRGRPGVQTGETHPSAHIKGDGCSFINSCCIKLLFDGDSHLFLSAVKGRYGIIVDMLFSN